MVILIMFTLSLLIVKLAIDKSDDAEYLEEYFWIALLMFVLNIIVIDIGYNLDDFMLQTEYIVCLLILITVIYCIIELLRKHYITNAYVLTYLIMLILEIINIYIYLASGIGATMVFDIIILFISICILKYIDQL